VRYVIIDTSSILFGFSYNRNVFDTAKEQLPGYRPLVSRGIVRELTRFSAEKGKKGLKARIALLELKAKKIDVDNIGTHADSWILHAARRHSGSAVITNDTALAERLASSNVRVYKMSRSGMLRMFSK
jgi:rRNA-processing protein FCF1